MRFIFTQTVGALAIALALGGHAQAQNASPTETDATRVPNIGSAIAPAGGAVDTSQGGVGGTGLGKMPPDSIDGKGLSVKGPAGQGLLPKQTSK